MSVSVAEWTASQTDLGILGSISEASQYFLAQMFHPSYNKKLMLPMMTVGSLLMKIRRTSGQVQASSPPTPHTNSHGDGYKSNF